MTKQHSHSDPEQYTKSAMRDRLKKKIIAGEKGGLSGQWSARKAQLLTHEYEAQGGGYKHKRSKAQASLKQWGDEKWQTTDGAPAKRGDTMARYLPEKVWDKLSSAEKKATEDKKRTASRKGQQFVSNTAKARTARKAVTTG